VLIKDTWGKPFQDPFVAESFIRSQTLKGIPLQALGDQVDELAVRRLAQLLHDVLESVFFFLVRYNIERGWNSGVVRFKLFE